MALSKKAIEKRRLAARLAGAKPYDVGWWPSTPAKLRIEDWGHDYGRFDLYMELEWGEDGLPDLWQSLLSLRGHKAIEKLRIEATLEACEPYKGLDFSLNENAGWVLLNGKRTKHKDPVSS